MSAEIGLWIAASAAWWAALALGVALWFWRWAPRSAEARHAVFAVAILAGTCAPMLPRWGGGWIRVAHDAAPTISEPLVEERSNVLPTTPVAWMPPLPATAPPAPVVSAEIEPEIPAKTPALSFAVPWPWLLVAVWGMGFFLHALRLAFAARIHRRWRREAQPLPADERTLFEQCRTALGVRRRVETGLHAEAPTPLVLCGWRPLVLAPTVWLARPVAEKSAAWRHELAHVRRGDDRWRLLSETLRTVWWWHPGVRWLLARREYEAELLSDEAAASADCPPRDLARLLVEACQAASPTHAHPAASFAALRSLKRRVARLADAESVEDLRRPAPRGFRTFAVVGAVLLALAGSMRLIASNAVAAPPTPLPPASDKVVGVSKTPNLAKLVVKLVDADTGVPIDKAVWQWGMANPAKRNEFIGAYRGGSSANPNGEFEMSFYFDFGSRIARFRVNAAGYEPEEVLKDIPEPTPDGIELTVKLKRGPSVIGTLFDHKGAPVSHGWVFFIPKGHKTRIVGGIPGGHTYELPGAVSRDPAVAEVRTDANGRFALRAGKEGTLAASTDLVDLWPFPLPQRGETATLQLPAPGYVAIDLSYWYIDHEYQKDAAKFSSDSEDPNQCWILVNRLGDGAPHWDAFDDYLRVLFAFAKNPRAPLTTGVTVGPIQTGQHPARVVSVGHNKSLATKVKVPLPPGTYSIQRVRAGAGAFAPIDGRTITVASGLETPLDWTRREGAAVRGAVNMRGNAKFVRKPGEAARELDWTVPLWQFLVIRSADGKVRDAAKIHHDGGFFVATHLEPGRYRAETVISLPSSGVDRSGSRVPKPELFGSQEFVVPEPPKAPAGAEPVDVEVTLQLHGERVTIADANAPKPATVVRSLNERTMEVANLDWTQSNNWYRQAFHRTDKGWSQQREATGGNSIMRLRLPDGMSYKRSPQDPAEPLDWKHAQSIRIGLEGVDDASKRALDDARKIPNTGRLPAGQYAAAAVVELLDGRDSVLYTHGRKELLATVKFVVGDDGQPPAHMEFALRAPPDAERGNWPKTRVTPVVEAKVKVSGKVELPTGMLFRRQVAKVAVMGPNPRPVGFKGVSVDPIDGRIVEELSWKHVKQIDVYVKANDGRDFRTFVKADESGNFAIPVALPPGGYQVDATAYLQPDDADKDRLHEPRTDLHANTELVRVKPGDMEPIKVALKLHAAGFTHRLREDDPAKRRATLEGKLTHSGKPVAGAKVVLYGGIATRWEIARAETDANGSYGFENLAGSIMGSGKEARYYIGVQFEHPTLVPADGKSWRDVTVPMTLGTAYKLDLELSEGGFIEGKTRPNIGVRMYIPVKPGERRGSTLFHAYASADAQGRFRSPPLFPGQYFVEENANDYPLVGETKVEAGKTATVGRN